MDDQIKRLEGALKELRWNFEERIWRMQKEVKK